MEICTAGSPTPCVFLSRWRYSSCAVGGEDEEPRVLHRQVDLVEIARVASPRRASRGLRAASSGGRKSATSASSSNGWELGDAMGFFITELEVYS